MSKNKNYTEEIISNFAQISSEPIKIHQDIKSISSSQSQDYLNKKYQPNDSNGNPECDEECQRLRTERKRGTLQKKQAQKQ